MEEQRKYTVVTFSPVQEFIEKSRKLRDLYGSSLLLSYLAYFTAKAAEAKRIPEIKELQVVSPGLGSVVRGTPDYIIIQGKFSEDDGEDLEKAFHLIWGRIVTICRKWLEEQFPDRKYTWKRHWNNWKNHAWEFFWGQGETIEEAHQNLYDRNYHQRVWVGVNWSGDSSDLSGGDAIAFPDMLKSNPMKSDYKSLRYEIGNYYQDLSYRVGEIYLASKPGLDHFDSEAAREAKIKEYGEAIISPREYLNIPELVKRLVMIDAVADRINNFDNLKLTEAQEYLRPAFTATKMVKLDTSFRDINRFKENRWSGWFVGDGDNMGSYTKGLSASELHEFSNSFLHWNEVFRQEFEENQSVGRLVFAGGDDFMGIFIPRQVEKKINSYLTGKRCLEWWQNFPDIWKQNGHSKDVTVSVGFVWAAPSVPQRGVLQHCNSAEMNAKDMGKDRIAIRVLFNSGNHLEWSSPWWFLRYLERYQKESWVNIYQDVACLESRHSFSCQDTSVAKGILEIYFGKDSLEVFDCLWNGQKAGISGILGDRKLFQDDNENLDQDKVNQALNEWVINLAKVGFHLLRNE